MAVRIEYPVDQYQLQSMSGMGYTHLTLWASQYPEGPYTNTGVLADKTIAQALANSDYVFIFDAPTAFPGQWFRVRAYNGSTYSAMSDASPFHGGGGVSLAVLRRRLGLFIADMLAGVTTQPGTASTAISGLVDVRRLNDDELNGWTFHRLLTGEQEVVADFARATGLITLAGPLSSPVGADEAFEVTRRFTPQDYRVALNDAIMSTYPILNRTVVHTGYLTGPDVYTYSVPQDIRTVSKVEVEAPDPSGGGHPWREVNWVPFRDHLHRAIEFKYQLPYVAGRRRIRITGIGPLEQLYSDTDTVSIEEAQIDLLVYKAAFHLYSRLPARAAATDRDYYQEMAKFYASLYEANKASSASGRPPRRNWGPFGRWRVRGVR